MTTPGPYARCCRGEEHGAKHSFSCPVYKANIEAFRRLMTGQVKP